MCNQIDLVTAKNNANALAQRMVEQGDMIADLLEALKACLNDLTEWKNAYKEIAAYIPDGKMSTDQIIEQAGQAIKKADG